VLTLLVTLLVLLAPYIVVALIILLALLLLGAYRSYLRTKRIERAVLAENLAIIRAYAYYAGPCRNCGLMISAHEGGFCPEVRYSDDPTECCVLCGGGPLLPDGLYCGLCKGVSSL
jgi:hypothetical protein